MADSDDNRPSRAANGDRTARARIRDAAIRRFAEDGVAATSVKAIAEDAGVSPPLVIHHFGSKDGLRAACDDYVNGLVWQMKEGIDAGLSTDPLEAVRRAGTELPLLQYLATTIPDGTAHVDALIDSMVEDTLRFMAAAEESGLVKPGEDRRGRAVVLVLWQLGALVLHRHAKRLLGADLTGPSEDTIKWWFPAGDILSNGVIDRDRYQQIREAAEAALTPQGGEE